MNSAGGAVLYEMVLNLASASGLSHSLLSADWDKATGFCWSGRGQLAKGSCSALNSVLHMVCPFIQWHGLNLYLALWLTILISRKKRVAVKSMGYGFVYCSLTVPPVVASVNPTTCLPTSRAENIETVLLSGLTPVWVCKGAMRKKTVTQDQRLPGNSRTRLLEESPQPVIWNSYILRAEFLNKNNFWQ